MVRNTALSFLVLLSLGLMFGCGVLNVGPASQVPLSTAGLDQSLAQLQANQDLYSIHYSLNSQNPPAVIFIPKSSAYTLRLIDRGVNQWYRAESPELLTQLIRRIRDNKFGGSRFPSLQAILTPGTEAGAEGRDFLAYIYSRGYATLSDVQGQPKTFALRPVPPQDNLKFNDRESGVGGSGAR